MNAPLKAVGGLSDVQDMTLIVDCQNINSAIESFRAALVRATNYAEAHALCKLARTWEKQMADLSDRAFDKLEQV